MAIDQTDELVALLLQEVKDLHSERLELKGDVWDEDHPEPYLLNGDIVVVDPWDDNGVPTGTCLFWIANQHGDDPILCSRNHYGEIRTSKIIGGGNLILIQQTLDY